MGYWEDVAKELREVKELLSQERTVMTPDYLRKIDALVAEKVMGWGIDLEAPAFVTWTTWRTPSGLAVRHWEPSTSIEHAWRVVEKLNADGLMVHFEAAPRDAFYAVINSHCDDDHWYPVNGAVVEAASMPLAICLAALKAVGVKLEPQGDGDAD